MLQQQCEPESLQHEWLLKPGSNLEVKGTESMAFAWLEEGALGAAIIDSFGHLRAAEII